MENYESKTGFGTTRDLASEGEKFAKRVAEEGEKFGKRMAERVGTAAGVAGAKIDEAIDYVDSTTQGVKDSIGKIRDEGWRGLRERTVDYTRKEPMTALCVAMCAGILVGWLTKRGR